MSVYGCVYRSADEGVFVCTYTFAFRVYTSLLHDLPQMN